MNPYMRGDTARVLSYTGSPVHTHPFNPIDSHCERVPSFCACQHDRCFYCATATWNGFDPASDGYGS